MCLAGYGQQPAGSACTPCAYGTFHAGGSTTCTACDDTTFYSPVDGKGAPFISNGMTLFTGAKGADSCGEFS